MHSISQSALDVQTSVVCLIVYDLLNDTRFDKTTLVS